MKAAVYRKYGPPEVLGIEQVPTPVPGEGQVLVEVRAGSINSWDWDLLTGVPKAYRNWGRFKPRYIIPGADIAGVVEAVGPGVTRLARGDEVFADLGNYGWGGFAEYVVVPEDAQAPKPVKLSFEETAALPQAGLLALQGLTTHRQIAPGDRVLINGAGGGVGTLGIPLALALGAEVTAVDAAHKLEPLRGLGAVELLDYEQTDYTATGTTYDLVLDNIGDRPVSAYKRALSPGGALVLVGIKPSRLIPFLLLKHFAGRQMGLLLYKANAEQLELLVEQVDAGTMKPIIDKVFPLDEVADAYRHFGSGRFVGKVVISIK